ncbi:MAG TPA: hypothetical protein VK477_05595, partial [Acidobacteriota bacterium]|nr:hypothetical protein [Acidobacteriota bacterium]
MHYAAELLKNFSWQRKKRPKRPPRKPARRRSNTRCCFFYPKPPALRSRRFVFLRSKKHRPKPQAKDGQIHEAISPPPQPSRSQARCAPRSIAWILRCAAEEKHTKVGAGVPDGDKCGSLGGDEPRAAI